MFDIGWTELLVLAAVAILIVGPKELPRMLRTIGNFAGRMRRMANEFRSQFDEAVREADLDDMRKSMESIRELDPLKGVKDSVSEGLDSLTGADKTRTADKPAADPPPEPAADTAPPETDADQAAAEKDSPAVGADRPGPAKAKKGKGAKPHADAAGSGA